MSASMLTLIELRKVIVDALIAKNIVSVEDRVFSSRTERIWKEEGNLICIYTPDNSFDDGDRNPVIYGVKSKVIIDIIVQGDRKFKINKKIETLGVDDQMDIIAYDVLNALVMQKTDSNIYANLPFKKVRLLSVQNTLMGNGEIEKSTQRITLEYSWYMELPILGIPEDEFLLAHTRIELAEQTKTDRLVDGDGNVLVDTEGNAIVGETRFESSGHDLEFDTQVRRSNQ